MINIRKHNVPNSKYIMTMDFHKNILLMEHLTFRTNMIKLCQPLLEGKKKSIILTLPDERKARFEMDFRLGQNLV